MTSLKCRRPLTAFLLSLAGGLLILGGGVSRVGVVATAFASGVPSLRGAMNVYYETLQQIGFASGFAYDLVPIVILSGIIVLIGAIMIYFQPAKVSPWGTVVLAFTFVSLVGTGGFLLGAVLGVVGGASALTWKRQRTDTGVRSEADSGSSSASTARPIGS